MADYFSQRCSSHNHKRDPSKSWDAIKPFMTNKSKGCNENITLNHNGELISNSNYVCDIFIGDFTNVAREIGSEEIRNEDEKLDDIFKTYE